MAGLNFNNLKVVSGEGHEYSLPESVRMQCVFCIHEESGAAYELHTDAFKPDVANRYLTVKMRFAKLNPQKGVVESHIIAKLYKSTEEKSGGVSHQIHSDSVPLERARREFKAIILEAMKEKAVDIHFVVREHHVKVMFRIHGKIEPIEKFAYTRDSVTGLLGAIYGETKDSNDTSFSPRLRSSCTIKYDEPPVSLRWQTIPTGDSHGNDYDVILRVTRQDTGADSKIITLGELGYLDDQVELLTAACNSKGGIFMSGITGSGKTTALRSLMEIVRGNGETKIYTVEDPIELRIFGATQINVRGGSMAETIKALMRADPDTIMVGEIRGKEVAEAMQDVLRSGHKMLTTIHASSGLGIVPRLSSESIGVSRDTIVEPNFVSCLVYQYLMPTLCLHCKINVSDARDKVAHIEHHLFHEDRYSLNPDTVFVANKNGCDRCRKGIAGMTICAETIRLTDEMAELLRDRKDSEALRQYRLQRHAPFDDPRMSGKTSYEAAIYKVSQGIIDPNDVNLMCGAMSLENIVKGHYA
jgi:type II secretory ATPase GspE/PulE/Tfp pilus assembly ATPase PilB-like protein